MNQTEHIFIINPVSGKGRGNAIADQIGQACRKLGWEYELRYTQPDLPASGIPAEYRGREKKKRVFWAVGGDGTLHEVLNGVAYTEDALGLIPIGSGNDFSRTVKDAGLQTGKIDAGRVNGRYFLNTVCFGIDGQVANNVDLMRGRWIPASQRYTASIVYTFVTYKEKPLEFLYGGQTRRMKSSVLTICNGRFYGGGYKIAPDARLDDGLLEMVYTDYIRRPLLVPLLLKLKRGRLYEAKEIHTDQITDIRIRSEETLSCNVDGEVVRGKEFLVEAAPGAVNFFYDPAFADMLSATS